QHKILTLLLVLCILTSDSAANLVRIGLKKKPYDENGRIATSVSTKEASFLAGRRYGLRAGLSDGSDPTDIISLKNYMNAQYFG
ncbi:hypothetical protein, partial [Mycobacterium tuberculosis]|uniref:hypothetical protein n=1 Tax=Mycobacterium tuberculosis TaxID=1773 RepID=UPI00254A3E36